MFNTIAAHVEFIQRDNIFRKVITNIIIYPEFALNRLIRSKQISNLNVEFFISFMTDKIYFFIADSSDSNYIAAAEQLILEFLLFFDRMIVNKGCQD